MPFIKNIHIVFIITTLLSLSAPLLSQPVIKFDKSIHDFKEYKLGETAQFIIKNDGNKPAIIVHGSAKGF